MRTVLKKNKVLGAANREMNLLKLEGKIMSLNFILELANISKELCPFSTKETWIHLKSKKRSWQETLVIEGTPKPRPKALRRLESNLWTAVVSFWIECQVKTQVLMKMHDLFQIIYLILYRSRLYDVEGSKAEVLACTLEPASKDCWVLGLLRQTL